MQSIDSVTLEVADTATAERFYAQAFGFDGQIRIQQSDAATEGFRSFTISLLVDGPTSATALHQSALTAGATELKAAKKSLWGFGSSLQAPDGTIITIASKNKKDKGPASHQIDQIVLLIGASDVAASKRFYVEQGLTVGKSFGSKYVEFTFASSPIHFAVNSREILAKNAGVDAAGSGSHRIIINTGSESFTDPDGFAWQPTSG
jgi:hypothetical protein